ncbi:unnamed protein product, partial [Prorocentrum cordatum]
HVNLKLKRRQSEGISCIFYRIDTTEGAGTWKQLLQVSDAKFSDENLRHLEVATATDAAQACILHIFNQLCKMQVGSDNIDGIKGAALQARTKAFTDLGVA